MTPPIPPTPSAPALQRDTALALWRQLLRTCTGDSDHDTAMRGAAQAAIDELEDTD